MCVSSSHTHNTKNINLIIYHQILIRQNPYHKTLNYDQCYYNIGSDPDPALHLTVKSLPLFTLTHQWTSSMEQVCCVMPSYFLSLSQTTFRAHTHDHVIFLMTIRLEM